MTFFANRDLNHLVVHATLNALAFCFSGVFSALFLLSVGLSLPEIFLVFGAILLLRFVLRPLVLITAPAIGLRRTLMLGTLLNGFQFPMLALVHGVGPALVAYCALTALGQVFYWTTYHAFFSALGDSELRGSQVAERQMLGAVAGVLGPAAGGFMLAAFGPWPAFLTAFVIQIAAVVPLHYVTEPPIARTAPGGIFAAAKTGIKLFVCDGWTINSSMTAWSIIMFRALGSRYDAFGGLLAAAALAGALSGMLLGRFIDRGHALRLTWAKRRHPGRQPCVQIDLRGGTITGHPGGDRHDDRWRPLYSVADDRGLQRSQAGAVPSALPIRCRRWMGCGRHARLPGLGRDLRRRAAVADRGAARAAHGAVADAAADGQLFGAGRAQPSGRG